MPDSAIIAQLVGGGWSRSDAEAAVIGIVANMQQSSSKKRWLWITLVGVGVLITVAGLYLFVFRDPGGPGIFSKTNTNKNTGALSSDTIPPFDALFYDYSTFGKPIEYVAFQEQAGRVDAITSALSYYYYIQKSYPNDLDALLGKPPPFGDPNSMYRNRTTNYFLDEDAVTSIPLDVYTAKAYSYSNQGENYSLQYMIKDVPTEKDTDGYMKRYTDPDWYDLEQFIEGINTADKSFLSVEVEKGQDSDEDGLSDHDEIRVYHTSLYDEDTDDDGVNDYDEVQAGTNANEARE
ncbi:MAG: hypothetical protein A2898_00365 [Candidatus Kerfeldbacteria bacterium RIFCSPLOWO2_01_FULL_48_11]|uniref:Uncharacterized protein n=1 Tax=Candidatus Kerfeldbacteria bacterium RIFCSPLOWO2_01_FULL_48_11 TaxID=1798543 RepID=A0A1G2B5Z8_9BACT|nr:MAG: hypothetical protein A2898_00365 [Candidatus Kerfeldbacteria bacterium RIFCSPLOWO2_01_FULL_48_11]